MSHDESHVNAIVLGLAWIAVSSAARAQSFTFAPGQIPQGSPFNNSSTENVDFADVDQDGDWDAAFADGGDEQQDQSRIWINQGLAQSGTIGFFVDVTATQAPVIVRQSRDIEFVDFDNDTDVDIYISNASSIVNQSSRFWTNQGNLQAGTSGFYQDETAARWLGLGGPGSSIAPSMVLGGGGYIDWSCDSDFGDLDNDGDLDLVQSSYGGVFGGNVPSRMFLNDGLGFFSEFNPSNFQLPGSTTTNGNPGLWCSGTQVANTLDATGVQCDIATSALDIDLGDIDGDLDLDLLHGARQEVPRMFANRLEENFGQPSPWFDVSGSVFPPGYATGTGHYAQEFGDFDADGDLDILGVNWHHSFPIGFLDVVLSNAGAGVFGNLVDLPGSASDDNEGDFLDDDNDGDLDILIANYSGQERVYRNTDGLGAYVLATGVLPTDTSRSLDADACDVDNDGDTDAFVANDSGQANTFLKNTLDDADTAAPRLERLEQALDRVAGPEPTVVRVQVYDADAYYVTWYHATRLEVQVDSDPPFEVPMQCSLGQIFRGGIDASVAGTISYRVLCTDQHGNTAASPVLTFDVDPGAPVGTSFCTPGSDLASTSCPCLASDGQVAAAGHGCGNSVFTGGALLSAAGTISPDSVQLTTSEIPAGVGSIYLQGSFDLSTTTPVQFGDGIRCAGGALLRLGLRNDTDNDSETTLGPASGDAQLSVLGATSPGATYVYQTYYRNPNPAWCAPNTFNVTQGIRITW